MSDSRLILTAEVTGLGSSGDIVEVKGGYARNYLLPRGLAIQATKGAEKQIAALRRARASREAHTLEDAKALAGSLSKLTVTLPAKAGQGGRLFGRITTADVVAAVSAAGGPDLDRRRVELPNSIKSTGTHTVTVRVHPEVTTEVTLEVVAS
ncbi:50S ribosomal protein L9 [Modestobacter sp. I12A-02628]|uniref:Large ribosomal subunit protein bL9 n=1 Tax=Goekera deserti TaxID=2497753 RepID=A0A7K3WFZ5_9ACTN|nr:50S ribosomal protein L9 [Goekera deserti]MPR00366.1 50S ribosomal protein L9 [Goekera deserti]NDI50431.1 50S ribosomal protein L9 [Goekera deserti]NEL55302.1 50S ribosomal protein L9 [Goekera deserti]